MFGVVSRPIFPEESHGADHFLKNGAQHAHLGPFWVRGWVQIKKTCYLPLKLILKYSKHPLLCLEVYRIQLYKIQNPRNFVTTSESKMAAKIA